MTGVTSGVGTAHQYRKHLSSSPVFVGVRMTPSLDLCVCFVDRCLSFCFWSLHCLSFFALRLLVTLLVSFVHCIVCPSLLYGFWLPRRYLLSIALSVLLFTGSDYSFGIFWSLHRLSFYLRLLVTTLVSFVHCIVGPLTYSF